MVEELINETGPEENYDVVIQMIVPEFEDFTLELEDFCNYKADMGKVCPFITADRDPNRKFKRIFNWDPQNCMWLCSWFRRPDLPALAKRTERNPG